MAEIFLIEPNVRSATFVYASNVCKKKKKRNKSGVGQFYTAVKRSEISVKRNVFFDRAWN